MSNFAVNSNPSIVNNLIQQQRSQQRNPEMYISQDQHFLKPYRQTGGGLMCSSDSYNGGKIENSSSEDYLPETPEDKSLYGNYRNNGVPIIKRLSKKNIFGHSPQSDDNMNLRQYDQFPNKNNTPSKKTPMKKGGMSAYAPRKTTGGQLLNDMNSVDVDYPIVVKGRRIHPQNVQFNLVNKKIRVPDSNIVRNPDDQIPNLDPYGQTNGKGGRKTGGQFVVRKMAPLKSLGGQFEMGEIKTNPYVEFLIKYARVKNISYKEAMSDPVAREIYRKLKNN